MLYRLAARTNELAEDEQLIEDFPAFIHSLAHDFAGSLPDPNRSMFCFRIVSILLVDGLLLLSPLLE